MKYYNVNIISLFLIWIVLAFVFGIYDLEISNQFVNQNSAWAKFLENYGMIPGLIVILTGIFINYSSISRNTNVWSYFKKIIFFLTVAGLLLYLAEIVLNNIVNENLVEDHFIICLIISFFISLLTLIPLQIKKPVQDKLLVIYSKTVLGMVFFGYVICIQGVKYFWGRVRYRELDATFSDFNAWYLPQGFTGFDSFPSGHAAMGWMLLPLLILFINRNKWIKGFVFSLMLIWGIVLASSRVVVGAHFASDVLFGSFFIILIFLLLIKKYKAELLDMR